MGRVQYDDSDCRSALNRVSGMPFRWSLNPYRGCIHACQYCYTRATHPYLGLNAGSDFSPRILVKRNMPEVLRRELVRPAWTLEMVALGTATEAHQPCEGRKRIARRILETLAEYGAPVSVVTKSTLIWRDRDVLTDLATLPRTRVHFTMTTLEEDVWRKLEPGTPPPVRRLEIMRRITESGVLCTVFIAPVIPRLADTEASLTRVVAAARDHGAIDVWAGPLRLAPPVKEQYFAFLSESFLELVPRYQRAYGGPDAPRAYRIGIEERIDRILDAYGFARPHDNLAPAGESGVVSLAAQRGQLALPI